MTKHIRLFLSLFFISIQLITIAQDIKPVQFSFEQTTHQGKPALLMKARVKDSTLLFSVKKSSPDEAFISTITFDSATTKLLSGEIEEKGVLHTTQDTTAGSETLHFFADSVYWLQAFKIAPGDSATIKGKVNWLAKSGDNFPSGEEAFSLKIKATAATAGVEPAKETLWSTFFICLAAGLAAVLTPCVFPLVPVTVSFFLKRSKSKSQGITNASWYSLSIILIYTVPTLMLTLLFGSNALYNIATHPITNLLFFVIFMVFAISFFGAFELSLPNAWANKADEKAGKGGFVGIFFMALTLVIVSFSCTGPIVGTLLGKTATQGLAMAPVVGMLGFGIGLAMPFSLFAYFPSMLKSLPKSGGWLNTVKVTFGFIELALAMKFLSNVDLAYHWRLLDREIFLVIWVVIFALLGLYLLGKLKFSHDSNVPYLPVPRFFLAIASFCFALYLFPGLWGAPLKAIGGWLPYSSTQDFNLQDLKYQLDDIKKSGVGAGATSSASAPKRYTEKLHAPFHLSAYFDLDEGMAAAKALNRPVMLDFTGHSCANCRKMEAEVWSDPEVLSRIKNDFVLISLYVDESTELPDNEKYINAQNEKVETLGDKNKDYEVTKFGFNAQPLYMFLDLKGNPLSDVKYGYDANVSKFLKHLDLVKREFDNRK